MAEAHYGRTKKVFNRGYDRNNPWFWIDIETSSLDFSTSDVLEIAIVVTDSGLNVWDSLHVVIHHPINILMLKSSNWCKEKFCSRSYGGNGLFDDCHYSNTSITDATHLMLNFFEYYSTHEIGRGRPAHKSRTFFDRTSGANGMKLSPYDISCQVQNFTGTRRSQGLLAGSTVYFDRRIIEKHFPVLRKYLSHKNVDVTSLLETAKRFHPDLIENKPKPTMVHRAMDDILDSLTLYKYLTRAHALPKTENP
ncbi:putative oligoribonuclease [Feldmannia species virus]|uniref:Putative oligoribonuclease n=1 Tax=Feldmannia species virus TaxID=39420 RepID=B5LWG6_9PHYC|nr:putative oligoribonuclease [Feldmannia species virus]ACH46829.1 putative oligoribonuclease [Feldmannia species virus]